jgi:hypothetical protein
VHPELIIIINSSALQVSKKPTTGKSNKTELYRLKETFVSPMFHFKQVSALTLHTEQTSSSDGAGDWDLLPFFPVIALVFLAMVFFFNPR